MTSTISKNVMRRVHLIRAVRPFVSGTMLASVIVLAAVWGIGREVWVAHVVENMPNIADLIAVSRFFTVAFLNTGFIVQMLTLVAGAALVYALADFVRAMNTQRRFA